MNVSERVEECTMCALGMFDRIFQIGDLDLDFANVIFETVNSAHKIRIDIRNPDDVSHSTPV